MRVLEPQELNRRREERQYKSRRVRGIGLSAGLILFLALGYVVAAILLPLPAIHARSATVPTFATRAPNLVWPDYGQSAIGAVGYGLLAKNGNQKAQPTASVAKIIAVVAILNARPLGLNEKGPLIPITLSDEAVYNQYVAQNQSVLPVQAGTSLTQYQALQAVLLPSANNVAEIMAAWAFGSVENYVNFTNNFVRSLGMKNTHVDDASGFSPKTVSTAEDLTILAEVAMNNPVIAEIVGQKKADLPVAGEVNNVNFLLGEDGIVGIKTGNTDQAGGCFMFAARREISGEKITIVGIIMGAPTRDVAISGSLELINSGFEQFSRQSIIQAGDTFGAFHTTDNEAIPIVTRGGMSAITWVDQPPSVSVTASSMALPVSPEATVGEVKVKIGNRDYTLPLFPKSQVPMPSIKWRLRHFAGYL